MIRGRVPVWIFLAGVLAGAGLFCGLVVVIVLARPPFVPVHPEPTAVITLIPAPTPTATAMMDLFSSPTSTPERGVVIDGIGKGLYVQISGTGGDGLRLRATASTSGEVRFLGYESEVFLVTDGPKNADGYIWWYLTAPYDESRSGWAVAEYLAPIVIQP